MALDLKEGLDTMTSFQKSVSEPLVQQNQGDKTFEDVRILFTEGSGGIFKWVDSGLCGILKTVQILHSNLVDKLITIPQIVHLKLLTAQDDLIFEYELPLNFIHNAQITSQLTSIKTNYGQLIGFYFKNELDRKTFDGLLK